MRLYKIGQLRPIDIGPRDAIIQDLIVWRVLTDLNHRDIHTICPLKDFTQRIKKLFLPMLSRRERRFGGWPFFFTHDCSNLHNSRGEKQASVDDETTSPNSYDTNEKDCNHLSLSFWKPKQEKNGERIDQSRQR